MGSSSNAGSLENLRREIVGCRRCPRLVAWREAKAADPPLRFRRDDYWARPVPGFGDIDAWLLIVGLAPAADGANRTGRVFTGDRSGDWLFRALWRAGFASQPDSVSRQDGMVLTGCYIAAAVRCAPPGNKPANEEMASCLPYLVRELRLLANLTTVVALGSIAWKAALRALGGNGIQLPSPLPSFGHGAEYRLGRYRLVGSYHPSPQNTNTGRLSEQGLDAIFASVQR
ncbi:MAG: uracil-DNA glycosylase [Actinomycetota bacterium]